MSEWYIKDDDIKRDIYTDGKWVGVASSNKSALRICDTRNADIEALTAELDRVKQNSGKAILALVEEWECIHSALKDECAQFQNRLDAIAREVQKVKIASSGEDLTRLLNNVYSLAIGK